MSAATLAALAIVTQGPVSLRAVPRAAAPQQATLWQGEVLELRGTRGDYASVYDHRLERGGYVRSSELRAISLVPGEAPALIAVVRFVRDTPGLEALGISYAAAYLGAAPAADIGPEVFDAIGGMAERLAQRASKVPASKASADAVAAALDVAAQAGIRMVTLEREGQAQVCYEGEMYRRVLGMANAGAAQRARAALGLTRHECVDPRLDPLARKSLDLWRESVLRQVPMENLAPQLQDRVHMRRAGVLAAVAYWQARDGEESMASADAAIDELAAVRKAELDGDDVAGYAEAAIRVGATRLAAGPATHRAGKLAVRTAPGDLGQTCVTLLRPATTATAEAVLAKRCTYGIVWSASASSNPAGTALALAVQPLAEWREIWVFREQVGGWGVDVLPPGSDAPGIGYAECAGWTPDSRQMMVVREVRSEGRYHRRFEMVNLSTLLIAKQAGTTELLPAFGRWQDPVWHSTTIALR